MKEQNYLDNLVGVWGHPVAENPGVVIQEAAFKELGIKNWRFLTIDVDPDMLGDAIKGLKAFKMKGINCTMPHKVEVLPYLDEIAESAQLIGAVNTIINDNGKLIGENTDGKGFMLALDSAGINPNGKNAVILGAGGAARAISVELALAGVQQITIVNRIEDRVIGEKLVELLSEKLKIKTIYVDWDVKFKVPADTNILVNATSIGLYPNIDQMPNIDFETVNKDMYIQDVIPNPAVTPFLREAEKRGAKWQTGVGMLVNQAALNIQMWTGKEPNKEIMIKALLEEIE